MDTDLRLTDRQRSILQGLADGMTTAVLAEHLGLSPKTVENHKTLIFARLQVHSAAQAVALALRAGLID